MYDPREALEQKPPHHRVLIVAPYHCSKQFRTILTKDIYLELYQYPLKKEIKVPSDQALKF